MTNPFSQVDIPKRQVCCAGKGERLQPGMEYYSLLLEKEDEQVIRQDFCLACWEETKEHLPPHSGYWKSRIEEKKEEETPSRLQKALQLFKQLMEAAHEHEEEIFVLALFLSHARQLILRKEFEQDGERWALYEIHQQAEGVRVKQLSLSQLATERVQHLLAEKLRV